MKVTLLAGGTGGAKLAAGMQSVVGSDLTVIANTGDDVETLGVYVSPDPDLVSYWLAGQVDEVRGWGIKDDGFDVFQRMARFGAPDWFSLSNLDLAACLYRRDFMDSGGRLTDAQAQIGRERFAAEFQTLFEAVDVLVCPTMPMAAPVVDAEGLPTVASSVRSRFTYPFNFSRNPTLSVPCGFDDANLPVSLQLVGRHFDEATLCRLGHAFQQATDWHRQTPPLVA